MLAVPEPPLPGQASETGALPASDVCSTTWLTSSSAMSASREMVCGAIVSWTLGVGPPSGKKALRISAARWNCRSVSTRQFLAEPRVLLPVPACAAHVGDRRQIVGKELVHHAVRAEQLRELADLRVARRSRAQNGYLPTTTRWQNLVMLASAWFICALVLPASSPSNSSTASEIMRANGFGRRETVPRRLTTCRRSFSLAGPACEG